MNYIRYNKIGSNKFSQYYGYTDQLIGSYKYQALSIYVGIRYKCSMGSY